MADPYREALDAELEHWPQVAVDYRHRSKHREAVLTYKNRSRFVIYPVSGSDWRGPRNKIAEVRRLLTALGAVRQQNVSTPRRPEGVKGMNTMVQFVPRIHVVDKLREAGKPLTYTEITKWVREDFNPSMDDKSLEQSVLSALHALKREGKVINAGSVGNLLTWSYVEPKAPVNPIMAEKLKPVIAAAAPKPTPVALTKQMVLDAMQSIGGWVTHPKIVDALDKKYPGQRDYFRANLHAVLYQLNKDGKVLRKKAPKGSGVGIRHAYAVAAQTTVGEQVVHAMQKSEPVSMTTLIVEALEQATKALTAREIAEQVAPKVGRSVDDIANGIVSVTLATLHKKGKTERKMVDNRLTHWLKGKTFGEPAEEKQEQVEMKSYVNPDAEKPAVPLPKVVEPQVEAPSTTDPMAAFRALGEAIDAVNRAKHVLGDSIALSVNEAGLLVGTVQLQLGGK